MERVGMRLHPKMPPLPQILAVAPNMPSWRLAAIVVFMTSSGWPSVVTSNMFSPAPSRRLLNLTGFFSSLGRAASMVSGMADPVTIDGCYRRWA